MEERFKKIIEQIKESTVNKEEIQKYILVIKRELKDLYEKCKDDESKEEIILDFLADYEKTLSFRGNAQEIFTEMLMNNAYKNIIQDYRGNKIRFDSLLREAKRRESENSTERVTTNRDLNECMISAFRYAIRTKGLTKEKDIIQYIQELKNVMTNELKSRMIHIIQETTGFLDDYGFLDEYIESSNEQLVELGLSELQYSKRNPIADEQYDGKGNLVKNVEDIGVIDTFETENLEKYSLEDLELMVAFWESKYIQERFCLSKAMAVAKTLNLWDCMLEGSDEDIEQKYGDKIEAASKKDTALTYLSGKEDKINNRMKRQYKKFLKDQGMSTDVELKDELKEMESDVLNLYQGSKDITVLTCLIMHQLKAKDIKVKKWGTIEDDKVRENDDEIMIVIENRNFRGPLVIGTTKKALKNLFDDEELTFPEYDKELDPTYCDIMSKLCMPANGYYNKVIKEVYNKKPQSQLYAELAGKKVRSDESLR